MATAGRINGKPAEAAGMAMTPIGSGRGPRRGDGAASSPSIASVGPAIDATRFDRLSRRHRECLRGVRALKGSKEIAEELGIEKTTVDSYLTEAVKVLGARNRRDAALQLAEYEQRAASGDTGNPVESETPAVAAEPPHKMGGDSARLPESAPTLPLAAQPDEVSVRQPGETGELPASGRSPGIRLPFRRVGQRGNDLSVGDRLIWIQIITLGTAIGFGMLMIGLQVLAGLIEAVSRQLT